ncbi:MAG TPA: protein kinase [Micromonosporaceae bacterium]
MTAASPVPRIPGYRDLVLHRRGSSADVYRAVHERLNLTVAIKLLRLDDTMTPEQFHHELDIAMRLSVRPHVIRILDTGTVDGRPYLAMEFCPDGSYAEIVSRHGPLSIADAVDVGVKIAEALQAAHETGLIHRDVTPGNLLRSRYGPALADFGIARKPAELSGTVTLNKLTPHHAAPEALLRQPQSVASDIYSLGSTLWFLLAGHPPYAQHGEQNPDPFTYRERALNRPTPLVPRPDVPVWLQTEIARAMNKQPRDRHPSTLAFGEALRRGWAHWRGEPWRPPADYPPLDTRSSSPHAQDPEKVPPDHAPWMPPGSAPPVPTPVRSPTAAFPTSPAGTGFPPGSGPWPPNPGTAAVSSPDPVTRPVSPGTVPVSAPAQPGRPGLRRVPVAVFLSAAVIGVVLGILVVVAFRPSTDGPSRPSASPEAATARIDADKAPTDVRLDDRGSSVVISWTDHTGNAAPHYIVGGPQRASPRAMTQAEKGITEVTIDALSPDADYCFTVIAVISVDEVAPSSQVCTDR